MQAIWNYREDIVLIVGLASNVLTIPLSLIALWTLIAKRKQLSFAFHMLVASHLDRRMSRVREALTRLDGLSYDEKTQRAEIRNLVAHLCGALSAVAEESEKLAQLVDELHEYHRGEKNLTEKHKRYLLSKLHGILDEIDHDARLRILGRQN